jgi:hypothetical protein
MIKIISILWFSVCMIASASSFAITTQNKVSNSSISKDFIERQIEQNMSIGRAIRSITSHYPQHIESIVSHALDLYPEQYREIIYAAISSQPALTEDVVRIALERGVSDCLDIVRVAIDAEPSYVDFVVNAAANSEPDELGEIVRVAIVTQPDSAETIVQSVGKLHPSRLKEIVRSAVNAVPRVGEYVVDALLAVFPSKAESVVSTAVSETNQKQAMSRIIESARKSGFSKEEVTEFALKGGMEASEIAALLSESDNKEEGN